MKKNPDFKPVSRQSNDGAYRRFEQLTKRLLQVPKKDLKEQEAKEKKRAG